MKTVTKQEIDKLADRLILSKTGLHGYCSVNKHGSTMICFGPKYHEQSECEFVFGRIKPNGDGWLAVDGLLEFCIKHDIEFK